MVDCGFGDFQGVEEVGALGVGPSGVRLLEEAGVGEVDSFDGGLEQSAGIEVVVRVAAVKVCQVCVLKLEGPCPPV